MRRYRALLPHPLESRLLVMQREGDWGLPEWEEAADHAWWRTDHVNRAVAVRFGVESTVLRCLRDDEARSERVYEFDNHSAAHDVAPACTWIGRAELDLLDIPDADARVLIDDWFRRDAGEEALLGSPWTRRGWYVEALAWSVARLREAGAETLEPPRQLRVSERAFLMRLATDAGAFFFRAAPEAAAHEAALVRWLADHYPDHVPDIVAIDASRGWLLQRIQPDGALPLEQVREEEEWYRAVRRLGELQRGCVGQVRALRRLGVPYRGLDVLAHRIPVLCSDRQALLPAAGGMSREEADRLAALAPTLLSLCAELAACDLPDTLEHGGLGAASVLSSLDEPLYLDWGDACISHPFFSPGLLMADAAALLPASSRESRRRLRDSYLAAWHGAAPDDALVRAFEIARILAPVHAAAALHADVLPLAGHAWDVVRLVPDRLRTALRLLAGEEAEPVPG